MASPLPSECRVPDTNTVNGIISVRWKNLDQKPEQKKIFVLDISGQLGFEGSSPEEEGNRVGLSATLVYVSLGKEAMPSLRALIASHLVTRIY